MASIGGCGIRGPGPHPQPRPLHADSTCLGAQQVGPWSSPVPFRPYSRSAQQMSLVLVSDRDQQGPLVLASDGDRQGPRGGTGRTGGVAQRAGWVPRGDGTLHGGLPSPCCRHPAPYSPPRLQVPWGQGPRLLGTWVSSCPGHWLLSPPLPLPSSLPSLSPPPCPLLCPLLPLPPPSPSPASFLSLPPSIETQLPAHSPSLTPCTPSTAQGPT